MANDDLDPIFRALADPTRRGILDALFARDGQSVSELDSRLPMTRFGVMKHLKVLEAAGLVIARKQGREKRHYLNAVPIQRVYDRWASRYAQPWARHLTDLKARMETPMGEYPAYIQEIFIRTTPEALWKAMTQPDLTEQYYFGSRIESALEPGGAYVMPDPAGGKPYHDGEIVEVDPPRKLVTTFRWHGEPPETKVTWLIKEAEPGLCKLTLLHEGLDPDAELTAAIKTGWSRILSGLKTVLETGSPMLKSA